MFGRGKKKKQRNKNKKGKKKKGELGLRSEVLTPSGQKKKLDQIITSPEYVEVGKGRLIFNDFTVIPMQIAAYPARVVEGWIADEFTWKPYLLDFVQFINPLDEERVVRELNRMITQLEARIQDMHEKGRTDTTSLEQELSYLYNYRERLISKLTRLFSLNTYFYLISKSPEEVEDYYEEFLKKMRARGAQPKRIRYRMVDALRMLLPEGKDYFRKKAMVDSEAVASCFPFAFPTLLHDTGVLYGLDAATRAPVIVDRFRFPGHNEIVVGKVGSGKSFFTKLEVMRWMFNDPDVKIYLVDPLAGFRDLATVLDSQTVVVGKNIMNPMDIAIPEGVDRKGILKEKMNSLLEFFSTFFEEEIGSPLDKSESGVIRKAILRAYSDTGFKPIIGDVIERLADVAAGEEEHRAAERIRSAMEAFIAELSMFNGRTDFNAEERVIYFDFSSVEGVEKSPLPMHAVLTWIGARVRAEPGKKIVIIDEAHYFMAYRQIRKFLERSIRHSRHHKTGYTLVTQGYEEFVRYEEGRTIIANTDLHIIFRQESLPEEVKRTLDIPAASERFVKEAVQGKVAGYSSALLASPAGNFHMNVFSSEGELAYLGSAGRGV